MPDVTIIGAGISGLSCAWTLKKLGIDAVVLEASSRPGGVIRTENIGGYQVEAGPNSFQTAPAALRFVDEAGLWDDLLPPTPNSPRFIYWKGKLRKFPFGPLSYSGILRAFSEPFVRSKSPIDESVHDFFARRVGRQVADRLVAPALTGIYAGNTANLSMVAAFPKIIEMEREHGSLLRAFFKSLRGRRATETSPTTATTSRPKPKGSIFSFPHGVETLPKRVAEQLCIRYNVADARVGETAVTVVTAPAHGAAGLVERHNAALSKLLTNVQYAPMVIAAIALPSHSFKDPLQGFGFLIPRNQGLHILGALFSSALFPDRAPQGQELLTCFVGGMFEPEAIDWPDERVWETVCSEIKAALNTSEMPQPVALFRQPHAIPQYRIGHERWVAAVKAELKETPGLFLTANYLEGVSVPACIEQGDRTARAVAKYLGREG
jgi:protoporphyrinogen/coproporphyrinogen III oxidase